MVYVHNNCYSGKIIGSPFVTVVIGLDEVRRHEVCSIKAWHLVWAKVDQMIYLSMGSFIFML